MSAANVEVQLQHMGGWIALGNGVALWVIWPPPERYVGEDADNENSLVIKLVYGNFLLLLTGDSGRPSETAWLESGISLESTILKVEHHGSTSATSEEFLRAVNPEVAVVQLGADNRYGHPHQEVLATLAGRLVLRNDLHGRIHVESDGRQMWIETEKNIPQLQNP